MTSVMPPVIINKKASFDPACIEVALKANHMVYWVDEDIMKEWFNKNLPPEIAHNAFLKKEEQTHKLDFLLDKLKIFLKIGNRDWKVAKEFIIKKSEDKTKIKEYFDFFGIEEKHYKEFGIEFGQRQRGIMDF